MKKTSIEISEKVRIAWKKYCKSKGRLMKGFTSEILTAIMKDEMIPVLKPKKRVKFKVVEDKK